MTSTFTAGLAMDDEVIGSSFAGPQDHFVEAFVTSLGVVALAEMGDKTQLLSFVLAARFAGKHWPIIAGIFLATIANHLCAAFAGDWIATKVSPDIMRWILAILFLAFAVWVLIPDTLDSKSQERVRHGAFLTTLVLFFLAETGDKTQLATVALGAKFASLATVTLGTTLGMMVANVPAVMIGEQLADRLPLNKMRYLAAALFAALGVLILLRMDLGLDLENL